MRVSFNSGTLLSFKTGSILCLFGRAFSLDNNVNGKLSDVFKMAYLKELRPGKRENAFYVNDNVIGTSPWEEYIATLPKKLFSILKLNKICT